MPYKRMTRFSKFNADMQPYYGYLDTLRWEAKAQHFELADRFQAVFHLPMPRSWSGKKREAMNGARHQQKPDVSNLIKSLEDALREDDERIWSVQAEKRWAEQGAIEVVNFTDCQ